MTGVKMIDGYRVKEAAQLLEISVSCVYWLCAKGKLKHFKIGGSIRIPKTALADIKRDILNNKLKHEI